MSGNEAQVSSSLQITKGNLVYPRSQPASFSADVTGSIGPTPGAVLATSAGTLVDLSKLSIPGLCRIMNQDPAGGNYVEYGPWDPDLSTFLPIGEVLPGESYVLRLSRRLGNEYGSPGTGTTGTGTRLMVRTVSASVWVLVEAFEA
jgi:hypothetical protein